MRSSAGTNASSRPYAIGSPHANIAEPTWWPCSPVYPCVGGGAGLVAAVVAPAPGVVGEALGGLVLAPEGVDCLFPAGAVLSRSSGRPRRRSWSPARAGRWHCTAKGVSVARCPPTDQALA